MVSDLFCVRREALERFETGLEKIVGDRTAKGGRLVGLVVDICGVRL